MVYQVVDQYWDLNSTVSSFHGNVCVINVYRQWCRVHGLSENIFYVMLWSSASLSHWWHICINAYLQTSPEKFFTVSFRAENGNVYLFPLFPLYTLRELDVFSESPTLSLWKHIFPGTDAGCDMDFVLTCWWRKLLKELTSAITFFPFRKACL